MEGRGGQEHHAGSQVGAVVGDGLRDGGGAGQGPRSRGSGADTGSGGGGGRRRLEAGELLNRRQQPQKWKGPQESQFWVEQ